MSQQTLAKGHTPINLRAIFNENFAEVYARSSVSAINVKDYGVTGDGETDDTTLFQYCIGLTPAGGICFVPNGTYLIDASDSLVIEKSFVMVLEKNAILKAIPNALAASKIIYINGTSDVSIFGGKLIGDWDDHTGVGETNHCIDCLDSSDVYFRDISFSQAAGDCVAAHRSAGDSYNVFIDHCKFTDYRRWGVFLDITQNGTIRDCVFETVTGDLTYGGGIDIEYHGVLTDQVVISGIKVINNIFKDIGTTLLSENGAISINGGSAYVDNVLIKDNICTNSNRFLTTSGIISIISSGNYTKDILYGYTIHCTLAGLQSIIIENSFFDTKGAIILNDVSASNYGAFSLYGVTIKNNIYLNFTDYAIEANMGNCNGISIIDNTFKNCTHYYNLPKIYARDVVLRNNIAYDADGNITLIDEAADVQKVPTLIASRGKTTGNPTAGTYEVGEWLNETGFVAAGYMGLICVTAGTMQTIDTTCVADDTAVVVITEPYNKQITLGVYVKIGGGVQLKVIAISGSNITMSANVAAGSGLAVANDPAAFRKFGALEPV